MVLTAEQRRYKISSNRVCAQSFVFEKDLPGGKKLLACSKCKETFYKDRESQLNHWPEHKHVCCALAKDDPLVRQGRGFDDCIQCMNLINNILVDPLAQIHGRLLLYCFQQLFAFIISNDIESEDRYPTADGREARFEDFATSIEARIRLQLRGRTGKSVIQRIMAIPGFTNFFLSEDIFLSPIITYRKSDVHCLSDVHRWSGPIWTSLSRNIACNKNSQIRKHFLSPTNSSIILALTVANKWIISMS
jgi:hypothetical protein